LWGRNCGHRLKQLVLTFRCAYHCGSVEDLIQAATTIATNFQHEVDFPLHILLAAALLADVNQHDLAKDLCALVPIDSSAGAEAADVIRVKTLHAWVLVRSPREDACQQGLEALHAIINTSSPSTVGLDLSHALLVLYSMERNDQDLAANLLEKAQTALNNHEKDNLLAVGALFEHSRNGIIDLETKESVKHLAPSLNDILKRRLEQLGF